MSLDNPGDFYLIDNLGDEDDDRPVTVYGKQLFRKSVDVLNITRTITDLLPEAEKDEAPGTTTKDLIMQNALIIPGKISAALATEIYSIKMEDAVLIKINIMQLKDQIWACEFVHETEKEYLQVLRDEVAAFKVIFINWIKSFDKTCDEPDEWHVFNDPDSFPDDERFDPEDFYNNYKPDDDE